MIFFILIYFFTGLPPAHALETQEPKSTISSKVQGIVINADNMLRDDEKQIVELNGHVQIIYKGQHLTSDYAKIELRTKKIECIGHVVITTPTTTSGGSMAIMDFESNTGLLYDGYVQAGPVIFEGKLLHKTGEKEFISSNANYTACNNCPASWSFYGSQIRAEIGGYAYIKNAFLKFGPVPVFWLPYLVVPLKSDRQTGLLTPEIEFSDSGGLTYSQPLYWAISRNTDLTYTFKSYEFRGQKALFNYRYVLGESSSGELDFGYLNDDFFKSEDRLNKYRSILEKNQAINRWFVKYRHYFETEDHIVHRTQLNVASDLQYPKDFPTETQNHEDSAMENRISVSKNTFDQHFSLDSSYYINLLRSNPLADQDDSVHRLPAITYSQMPRAIGNSSFYYGHDLDYTNFVRNGKAYDDIETVNFNNTNYKTIKNSCHKTNYDQTPGDNCRELNDGVFDDSTDIIRAGQRLNFQPSIYRPFQLGDLDISPKLSYKETKYIFQLPTDPQSTRRYIRAEISAKSIFSDIYHFENSYKHELIPELTYTVTPWIDHSSHAFYGFGNQRHEPIYTKNVINDGDLASDFGFQFDYSDRIIDRNLVTFSLTNKITEKSWKDHVPSYQQIALIKIYQSYDAYQSSSTSIAREPFSDLAALINLRINPFETYSILNYFPYQNVTNISSRLRYTTEHGHFMQVALTKQYGITPGKAVNTDTRTEDYELHGGFKVDYLRMTGKIVYDGNYDNQLYYRIKSWSYGAQFIPPGDCWFITLLHEQVTGGQRTIKINFAFIFDGKTPTSVMPALNF